MNCKLKMLVYSYRKAIFGSWKANMDQHMNNFSQS